MAIADTKRWVIVKGPKINQYVGTVSHLLFRYCKWTNYESLWKRQRRALLITSRIAVRKPRRETPQKKTTALCCFLGPPFLPNAWGAIRVTFLTRDRHFSGGVPRGKSLVVPFPTHQSPRIWVQYMSPYTYRDSHHFQGPSGWQPTKKPEWQPKNYWLICLDFSLAIKAFKRDHWITQFPGIKQHTWYTHLLWWIYLKVQIDGTDTKR